MRYLITIAKDGRVVAQYPAVGNRDALMDAAYDEYDVCSVSIMVHE